MKKYKKYFYGPSLFFLIFLLFTVLVATVDRKPFGAGGTYIGFSWLNNLLLVKYTPIIEKLSDWCGYLAILVCLFFAGVGVFQLIKRKKIYKVDYRIILLGLLYASAILFYVIFEIVHVNFRPVVIDGELAASYPSSHTVLAICTFASAPVGADILTKKHKEMRPYIRLVAYALTLLTVLLRLFSGVHWFTDIVGGILLSSSLLGFFFAGIKVIMEIRKTEKEKNE